MKQYLFYVPLFGEGETEEQAFGNMLDGLSDKLKNDETDGFGYEACEELLASE